MRHLKAISWSLLIIAAISVHAALGAAKRELELPWSELHGYQGKNIAFTLPDGTYLEGVATAFDADSLKMYVRSTSNRTLHPPGETRIPRAAVTEFEYRSKT